MLGIVTWLSAKAEAFILLGDLILMSTYIKQAENGLEMGRGREEGVDGNTGNRVPWLGDFVSPKLVFNRKWGFH